MIVNIVYLVLCIVKHRAKATSVYDRSFSQARSFSSNPRRRKRVYKRLAQLLGYLIKQSYDQYRAVIVRCRECYRCSSVQCREVDTADRLSSRRERVQIYHVHAKSLGVLAYGTHREPGHLKANNLCTLRQLRDSWCYSNLGQSIIFFFFFAQLFLT